MNAYYGAGPILNALNRLCTMDIGCDSLQVPVCRGAEIVVTGRATDSALALAPLMHEFGYLQYFLTLSHFV